MTAEIAAHKSVEIVLELPDPIERPFLRQGRGGVRRRADAVIIERRGVAPEREVDAEGHLLDRAHAIEPVRARIARKIEPFVGGKIGVGTPREEGRAVAGARSPADRRAASMTSLASRRYREAAFAEVSPSRMASRMRRPPLPLTICTWVCNEFQNAFISSSVRFAMTLSI